MAGASEFNRRGSKSKAPPSLPLVDPPFIGKSTSYPLPPAQDLLLCAKHLFVAAMVAEVHPGLPRIGNSAGFFILSQLPAWAKKAPRTCRKRGAGPLSDRKSQSIVRLSKDQGGSSVLLDTPVVNCLFNRRQYYFVIGPIPVLYAQAAD